VEFDNFVMALDLYRMGSVAKHRRNGVGPHERRTPQGGMPSNKLVEMGTATERGLAALRNSECLRRWGGERKNPECLRHCTRTPATEPTNVPMAQRVWTDGTAAGKGTPSFELQSREGLHRREKGARSGFDAKCRVQGTLHECAASEGKTRMKMR
jgi:hypothetical protein